MKPDSSDIERPRTTPRWSQSESRRRPDNPIPPQYYQEEVRPPPPRSSSRPEPPPRRNRPDQPLPSLVVNNNSLRKEMQDSFSTRGSDRTPGAFRVGGGEEDDDDQGSLVPIENDEELQQLRSALGVNLPRDPSGGGLTMSTLSTDNATNNTPPTPGVTASGVTTPVVPPAQDAGQETKDRKWWSQPRWVWLALIGLLIVVGAVVGVVVGVSGGNDDNNNGPSPTPAPSPEWTLRGTPLEGASQGDELGWVVSLTATGTRLAMGALPIEGSGANRGYVRILDFDKATNDWSPVGDDIVLDGDEIETGVFCRLSADGTTVVVGGTAIGRVRVYRRNDRNEWIQLGQDLFGNMPLDRFGYAVSISQAGSVIAVGTPFNEGTPDGKGLVQIYELVNNTVWMQVGMDLYTSNASADPGVLSLDMSADGSKVAVGAVSAEDEGQVRVWQRIDNDWSQLGQTIEGETYGNAVSLSGDASLLAIGAPSGQVQGQAMVFSLSNNDEWTTLGQTLVGEAPDDFFGSSLSLSSDGTTLAIGAFANDGNGPRSGHARVFGRNEEGSWMQIGEDIDGDEAYDEAGRSVSLSSDGTTLAMGAPAYGDLTGQVRTYQLQV